HVDDRSRHEEWRDLAHATMEVGHLRVLDHRQTADAGTHADAHALLVPAVAIEARVLDRLHRRDEAVMDERIVAARFLRRQILAHIEILHFAGDMYGEVARVEARDPGDAGMAREDA